MIQVIIGSKGSRKTVKLIDMANEAVNQERGNICFINDNDRHNHDLHRDIRMVNAREYGIDSPEAFYGMLSGMLASNYDITLIVVDGFMKMMDASVTPADLECFFDKTDKLLQLNERNVRLVLGISGEAADMPEFITRYAI